MKKMSIGEIVKSLPSFIKLKANNERSKTKTILLKTATGIINVVVINTYNKKYVVFLKLIFITNETINKIKTAKVT